MLRVLGRRADGYHELQTVFQFVDLQDSLDFRLRADGDIRRLNEVVGVASKDDLIVRAALALQKATGCRAGVDVRIDKRLPMGGGLGGGSSDAATTLVALNRLWNCGLDHRELAKIGLELGADVPVFVYGRAAWAEGVGEKLQSVEPESPVYLLLNPACHVSTAEIFRDRELTRNSPRITIRAFLAGDERNDCLAVVRKRHPQVAAALDWLGQYSAPRLTGTGGCVFASFARKDLAEAAARLAPCAAYVLQGMNRSPLLQRLQQE